MPQSDNTWSIKLKNFGNGFAPLAFYDSLTEVGNGGHASVMQNVDVLDNRLTQGPGLADLTNGTQAGNVTELINFILDKATANNIGWALGATKLFKLSSTAVVSGAAVSGCVDGESLTTLKGNYHDKQDCECDPQASNWQPSRRASKQGKGCRGQGSIPSALQNADR